MNENVAMHRAKVIKPPLCLNNKYLGQKEWNVLQKYHSLGK